MEWRPAYVVRGLGLGMSFNGLFTEQLGQDPAIDTATVGSRFIRQ